MTTKALHFKWTVSRGRYTYGYNICTLLVDGYKVGKCMGVGYDMQGTSFAEWLEDAYQADLSKLFKDEMDNLADVKTSFRANASKFYGATLNGTEFHHWVTLDGGCGFDSMKCIAEAIGIKLQWNEESDKYKNHTFYTAIID